MDIIHRLLTLHGNCCIIYVFLPFALGIITGGISANDCDERINSTSTTFGYIVPKSYYSQCKWIIQAQHRKQRIFVSISGVFVQKTKQNGQGTGNCQAQLSVLLHTDDEPSVFYLCGQGEIKKDLLSNSSLVEIKFTNEDQDVPANFKILYFSYIAEQTLPGYQLRLNASVWSKSLQFFPTSSDIHASDKKYAWTIVSPSEMYGVAATLLMHLQDAINSCTSFAIYDGNSSRATEMLCADVDYNDYTPISVVSKGRFMHLEFRYSSQSLSSATSTVYGFLLIYSTFLLADSDTIGHFCINGGNITSVGCNCPIGWTGDRCQIDIDECAIGKPCFNNGSCTNVNGSYHCNCGKRFSGQQCEEDIDECLFSSDPRAKCGNNGNCINTFGSYKCNCNQGWSGSNCNNDINECAIGKPCFNNGICTNVNGSYHCNCGKRFSGQQCEEDIDECLPSSNARAKCGNNGDCINTFGSYRCNCNQGWSGSNCNNDIDECNTQSNKVPCLNGGSCVNSKGSFNCSCLDRYAGEYCQFVIQGMQTGAEEDKAQTQYVQKDLVVAAVVSFVLGATVVLASVLVIFLKRTNKCFFQKNGPTSEEKNSAYEGAMVDTNIDEWEEGTASTANTANTQNSISASAYQQLSGVTNDCMPGEHVYTRLSPSKLTPTTGADENREKDGAYVYIDNVPQANGNSDRVPSVNKTSMSIGGQAKQDGPTYLALEPVVHGTNTNTNLPTKFTLEKACIDNVQDKESTISHDGPTYFVLEKETPDPKQDQNNLSSDGPTYFVLEKDDSDPVPTSDGGPTYFVLEKENLDREQNDRTSDPSYFVLEKEG